MYDACLTVVIATLWTIKDEVLEERDEELADMLAAQLPLVVRRLEQTKGLELSRHRRARDVEEEGLVGLVKGVRSATGSH